MALQEEQLFGAPPGDLVGVNLMIGFLDDGGVGVELSGFAANRRDAMSLRVRGQHKGDTSYIIGALTPLLQRASGMSVAGFRRWTWAAHNTLGRDGYEVQIARCGREPKR